MNSIVRAFGFFHWIGISHYLNLLFLGFMVRSGLEILSAHPKLYWNDGCQPETEWLKFTRKQMPKDRLWTAEDEQTEFPSWIVHGAPCRLRVETQLGFKMVKFLRSIELVVDYREVGDGQGGYREDVQFYGSEAGI